MDRHTDMTGRHKTRIFSRDNKITPHTFQRGWYKKGLGNLVLHPTISYNQKEKHYENMPMQYTEIFIGVKNENFQQKKFDIFLIFAQNIDCGYTFKPPRRGGSNEYPQSSICSKNKTRGPLVLRTLT